MSSDRRSAAATAGTGLAMVGAGGALRHKALEAAYKGKKRPKLMHERIFLSRKKLPGRRRYLAGGGLALLGTPGAATGVHQLTRKETASKRDRNFLLEGIDGATDAFQSRGDLVKDKPPPKLVAGNYLASAGAGAGGGALTHQLARKLPGSARAAAAATGAVATGVSTIPLQAKVISRRTKGEYTATPVGVRRNKTKPVRPSRGALVADSRQDPRAARRMIVPGEFGKAEDHLNYPGSRMSPRKKRAAVIAAGGPPLIGDFTSAAAAARMAPPELRKKTAALQYGGAQGGQAAGALVGGYGAAALARKIPSVGRGATRAQAKMGEAKHEAVRRASPKAAQRMAESSYSNKPSMGARAADKTKGLPGAAKVRSAASRAAKPMFGHGKGVAAASALGLMGGQIAGGYSGGYAGYGHALAMERKRNARLSKRSDSATRGGKPTKTQLREEGERLNSRKRQQAILSTVSGTTGLAALGATIGARGKINTRIKGKLKASQTPLLTTSAGVGGYGSLNFAGIQRGEARRSEQLEKALLGPRTFRMRRPSPRKGYLRSTGSAPRRTTYVRGGVV